MAAANLHNRKLASFGKRFVSQIVPRDSTLLPTTFLSFRRVHVSVYDKNPEEHVRPTVVPDDVIASHSDKYWAPNPQTGVFGPETDHKPTAGTAAIGSIGEDSVLEQKAFFRPLEVEDLEKPPHP
ncbi:late embryogenesis abundant protein At5g17165-like isoform X1 [Olea europaea var. sylvestris]|uniref:late embryogenesis abundant protein At5g17165-like isoform X1 n=1 Tax=Olea europaea var. sylvestris TaxID=158386 RepID=UPI000C1CE3C4|nr:late embryogenesis abundant protein At5g17165-like isoform X1 [Olea europaea var. sylvestris]